MRIKRDDNTDAGVRGLPNHVPYIVLLCTTTTTTRICTYVPGSPSIVRVRYPPQLGRYNVGYATRRKFTT